MPYEALSLHPRSRYCTEHTLNKKSTLVTLLPPTLGNLSLAQQPKWSQVSTETQIPYWFATDSSVGDSSHRFQMILLYRQDKVKRRTYFFMVLALEDSVVLAELAARLIVLLEISGIRPISSSSTDEYHGRNYSAFLC